MAGVAVVGYDPSWPELFAAERADLEQALVPWLSGGIHDVGSTAVPGLAAKPIPDMIAGVHDLGEARAAIAVLSTPGIRARAAPAARAVVLQAARHWRGAAHAPSASHRAGQRPMAKTSIRATPARPVADSHLPRLDSANPAAWLTLAATRESPVSIAVIPVALLALYGVIRLALRHGVEDAWPRRRQLDESAAETEQFGPRPM